VRWRQIERLENFEQFKRREPGQSCRSKQRTNTSLARSFAAVA
jgi:hypothetical protein